MEIIFSRLEHVILFVAAFSMDAEELQAEHTEILRVTLQHTVMYLSPFSLSHPVDITGL
jgi:hypothetical protein